MTLQELFANTSIIEFDEVDCKGECENYYRLYIESQTSDALSITIDVVKEVFEQLDESQFWNNKKLTQPRQMI